MPLPRRYPWIAPTMPLEPEQVTIIAGAAFGSGATAFGFAMRGIISWYRANREYDIKQTKIESDVRIEQAKSASDARVSTVTSFANELGINKEILTQLMQRDVEIAKLSGQMSALSVELNTLKLKQAQSDEKIKLLEEENQALQDKLVLSDQRIADLETDNKVLRRQLDLERAQREALEQQRDTRVNEVSPLN